MLMRSIYLGFRLRSTLGYFKGHPSGVQERRSVEWKIGAAKLQRAEHVEPHDEPAIGRTNC